MTNKVISIIVISYNRQKSCFETILNVQQLETPEGYFKQIVVINNGSDESYNVIKNLHIDYFRSTKNLGVSGGRNLGISKSVGNYIVFIDDDAIFKYEDSLVYLIHKFKQADVVGFAVWDYYANKWDLPVKNKERRKCDEFYNNVFWGGAVAFKRSVFDKIGMFDESFFYGMEEYDLSYKAIQAGFKIYFTRNIVVIHKHKISGKYNIKKYKGMFENKCLVAWRYLPFRYFVSHLIFWGGFLLVRSKSFIHLFDSMYRLFKKLNKRKVIDTKYIKSVSGRLNY